MEPAREVLVLEPPAYLKNLMRLQQPPVSTAVEHIKTNISARISTLQQAKDTLTTSQAEGIRALLLHGVRLQAEREVLLPPHLLLPMQIVLLIKGRPVIQTITQTKSIVASPTKILNAQIQIHNFPTATPANTKAALLSHRPRVPHPIVYREAMGEELAVNVSAVVGAQPVDAILQQNPQIQAILHTGTAHKE